MDTRNPKRAVVIGAGLGGLATALRLAHRGWRVTVCERAATPGGKMNRLELDGFRFDTGPSLITLPRVFRELFADLGTRLEDHLELLPVDPAAEYRFDDGTRFVHTAALPAWLDTVRRLEGGSAAGFLRFMELGARLLTLSEATFFRQSPVEGPPDPAALGALTRSWPLPAPWQSYHEIVTRHFRSDALRRMFDRYPTYIGSSPYQTPAMLAVIPVLEYLEGAWHIRGGLYHLIEILVALADRSGVDLRLNTPVEAIETRDRRITGVRTAAGTRIPADVVVMNGDASRLPALLGRIPGAGIPRPERDHSLSGLVFLFALNREQPDAPHHRVLFSADYRQEFDDLFTARRFPRDPTIYLNMPSRTDRSMTPGRGEVLFVMANAPANEADAWDAAAVDAARAAVHRRLERARLGGLLTDVTATAVRTPQDLATLYDMPGGAIYGSVSHGPRRAFLRPRNRHARIGGLYLVGGSTHPGGGTPTVLMSSRITTELITRHEAN